MFGLLASRMHVVVLTHQSNRKRYARQKGVDAQWEFAFRCLTRDHYAEMKHYEKETRSNVINVHLCRGLESSVIRPKRGRSIAVDLILELLAQELSPISS